MCIYGKYSYTFSIGVSGFIAIPTLEPFSFIKLIFFITSSLFLQASKWNVIILGSSAENTSIPVSTSSTIKCMSNGKFDILFI